MANALTNTQIENYLKDYKRFKGCFFKDTLPEELEVRCYYIVNIDDSDSFTTDNTNDVSYSSLVVWVDI